MIILQPKIYLILNKLIVLIMNEHRKIYRVFQFISRLRSPLGSTKEELANDLEACIRTVERYIKLLRDLGFEIEKSGKRFKIEKIDRQNLKHEDLIVFTLEEAATVKEALLNSKTTGMLQKSLLDKLYALTDLDQLSDTLYRVTVSKNISNIRFAIKHQEQVILKSYRSVSSEKVTDRVVEPLKFYDYFKYIIAFELSTQKIKQYKTERIGKVENTSTKFRFKDYHQNLGVDIFGMSADKPVKVKLLLGSRAQRLLVEEFPDAAPSVKKHKGKYTFCGSVYSFEGIGRFVMGLLDDVKVIEPAGLNDYIKNKIEKAGLIK